MTGNRVAKRNAPTNRKEVAAALGERIARLRKKRGWTREGLANQCHLHPASMARIESGKSSFTLNTLLLLTQALKTDIHKLIAGIA